MKTQEGIEMVAHTISMPRYFVAHYKECKCHLFVDVRMHRHVKESSKARGLSRS